MIQLFKDINSALKHNCLRRAINLKYPIPIPSLWENFAWLFVGNLLFSGSQWAVLIMLAQFGNTVMVGQFALGLAICTPIMVFSNLQLRVIQATDVGNKFNFGDYLWLRITTTFLAFVVIIGIIMWGNFNSYTAGVVLLVGIAKCFESISDIFYGFSQKYERLDLIALSMMIRGPLGLIGMIIGLYFSGNIIWGIIGLAISWFIPLIIIDIPIAIHLMHFLPNKTKKPWQPNAIKRIIDLFWMTVPMGWVVFILSFSFYLPRYFLQSAYGETDVGLFSAVAALPGIIGLIVIPIMHSVLPKLASLYSDQNRNYWKLLSKSSLIVGMSGLFFVGVTVLVGEFLLTNIYGKTYSHLSWLLIILGISGTAQNISTIFGAGLTAMHRFFTQGILCTIYAALTLLLCLFLVPRYGLLGGGLSTILSSFFHVLILGIILWFISHAGKSAK